jgi:hypothetical protein
MAVSAWGKVVADTVTKINAIVPGVAPQHRFKHVDQSKSDQGLGTRNYRTRDEIDTNPPTVFGGGERQETWDLMVRVTYRSCSEIHDMIGSDHKSLIEALQPSRTYPSGSDYSLKVRRVMEFEGPEEDDEDASILNVVYPIHLVFRYQLTLI